VWQFLAPPDAPPPFHMPELPADFVDVWPIDDEAQLNTDIAGYLQGGIFPDWDSMRKHRGFGVIGEDGVLLPIDAADDVFARVSAGGRFD
jgi:hypothetical protein